MVTPAMHDNKTSIQAKEVHERNTAEYLEVFGTENIV